MKQFCYWSGMEINMLKTKATALDHGTGEVQTDLGVHATATALRPSNICAKPREVCNLEFDGEKIDFVQPSAPMTYLGYDMTLTGCWKAEIARIKAKTAGLAAVLDKHKFTDGQGRYLF
eukprot:1108186-Rhodomonas_salina.1